MQTIALSDFVRRQTPDSTFSHYAGTEEGLLKLVDENWNRAIPGYRDGVVLVPVPPKGFYSSIVYLKEGDKLEGTWKRRQPGEEPRRSMWVAGGPKSPAVRVDIVCYSKEVLQETHERSCSADWEIISINANITNESVPLTVGTLIANHFGWSGGTSTGMTDAQFVKALKASAEFWKDKAFVGRSETESLRQENLLLKRRIGDVETFLFSQN
jgi:hypothetical protein